MAKVTYQSAGVDLDVYRESMSRLPRLMHRTFSPRVIRQDGGFAGLFALDFTNRLFARNYQQPVLVSGTDGVGTKLKVASLAGVHQTIGIDLVAMCVNDIICCGAEPLFFLDYVAMSKDDPDQLAQIVAGISDGCVAADCALLAGETAIMPDLYQPGEYDLAGFCVGVVERARLIDGQQIAAGDVVIGLASSGLHSNGYSLVRKIVFELAGLRPDSPVPFGNQTVAEVLLTPTRIYSAAIASLMRLEPCPVHGLAHITGGGLEENLERILPPSVNVEVQACWDVPPVFPWLQELGGVELPEMRRVFNMGIGFVVIVPESAAENVQQTLKQSQIPAWQIGRVVPGEGKLVVT